MATTVTARQLPSRRVLQISSIVLGSLAVTLVAMLALARPPDTSRVTPGDVIDEFLSARQTGDVDTATNLFQSDATITDSAGHTSRGIALRHVSSSVTAVSSRGPVR